MLTVHQVLYSYLSSVLLDQPFSGPLVSSVAPVQLLRPIRKNDACHKRLKAL